MPAPPASPPAIEHVQDLDALFDGKGTLRPLAVAVPAGAPSPRETERPPGTRSLGSDPRLRVPDSRSVSPREKLLEAAKRVLEVNREPGAGYTSPNREVYPYRWLWDSVFHSLGYRHFAPELAAKELETLLESQRPDGLIPHVSSLRLVERRDEALRSGRWLDAARFGIFEPIYTRLFYGAGRGGDSTLTQPPIVAEGVLAVAEKLPAREAERFLERVYPRLAAYYDWLERERDPDGDGLIVVEHPWETGADDSPRFDAAYGLNGGRLDALKRHWAAFRRVAGGSPPKVAAVDMNTYYCANLAALSKIAARARDRDGERRFAARAERTRESILAKLWDEELGLFVDLTEGSGPSRVVSPFGLFPLYAGVLSPGDPRVARLFARLDEPDLSGRFGPPSVGRSEPSFDPKAYWRGTVWINVNYLLARSMLRYGRRDEARRLLETTLGLISRGGFAEYFDPDTGEGYGAKPYSWTAALAVEMDAILLALDR